MLRRRNSLSRRSVAADRAGSAVAIAAARSDSRAEWASLAKKPEGHGVMGRMKGLQMFSIDRSLG